MNSVQQQADVMNYSLWNEQCAINWKKRSACVYVCEAVIWRIWQEPSEHGENGSGERGLAKCSCVSWNHRAAGKWINKYPLQPCCLFPCFGRAGKARSPVAACTLVRQTAADLWLFFPQCSLEKYAGLVYMAPRVPAEPDRQHCTTPNSFNYSDSENETRLTKWGILILMHCDILKHTCCHQINKYKTLICH